MDLKILKILNEIRVSIKKYSEKNNMLFTSYDIEMKIDTNFPILELEPNIEIGKCSIHGGTYIDIKNWYSLYPGIKVAELDTISISRMLLCFKNKNNEYLPLAAIIHTFLHELSHTITIPEQINSKHITQKRKKIQPTVENKKKNAFMQNHHSNNFYINFAKILRIAKNLGIYILPKTYHNLQIKNLQRYDSLVNPEDLMSLGTTKYIL